MENDDLLFDANGTFIKSEWFPQLATTILDNSDELWKPCRMGNLDSHIAKFDGSQHRDNLVSEYYFASRYIGMRDTQAMMSDRDLIQVCDKSKLSHNYHEPLYDVCVRNPNEQNLLGIRAPCMGTSCLQIHHDLS